MYDSQYNASVGSSKGCLVVDSCRVGFRKVSIDSGVLRLNEHPIIIAGINRHEFDPLTGRAVSEKSMYSDARIIKKLNFNAVRTSHYPNHPFWLEICDEIGLLVIDEANIETHGFQSAGQPIGYLAGLQEWQEAFGDNTNIITFCYIFIYIMLYLYILYILYCCIKYTSESYNSHV